MNKRPVGPFNVHPIGLGCMNICPVYGPPPSLADAQRLLLSAGCQDLPPAWPLYGDVLLVEEQIRRHGGRRDQAREGDRSEECAAQMHSRRAGAKEFRDSGLRFLMDLELNIDT